MIVFCNDLILKAVPSDTHAPWLGKTSTKWELVKPLVVKFHGDALVVPEGYITDLASIPRIAWRISPPGGEYSRRPAVIHDYIYSHLHGMYTKEYADRLFYEGLLREGMPKWKAWLFYLAVSIGGKGGWE